MAATIYCIYVQYSCVESTEGIAPMTSLSFLSIPEDDDVLAEKITLLAGQLNSGDYCLLKFIAAFDRREAWSGGGTVRSCAHWLNWRAGITLGAARERVRVARALEQQIGRAHV